MPLEVTFEFLGIHCFHRVAFDGTIVGSVADLTKHHFTDIVWRLLWLHRQSLER